MADEALQTKVGKERILHAKPEELTKSFLEDLFASYHDRETNTYKESPFKTTDVILLTKADYPFLKEEKIQTTLGKLYFNRYCLELPGVIEHIGFWNEPITAKGLEKLTSVVNDLVILDKIDTKTLGEYIDARDRLGFWSAGFLSTSKNLCINDICGICVISFKPYSLRLLSTSLEESPFNLIFSYPFKKRLLYKL